MPGKNCPICQYPNCLPHPNQFLKNDLLRCQKCGLIFVWPQKQPENIKKIYNSNYFKNKNSNSIGYKNYVKDRPNIIKTFEKRLKKIEKLSGKKGKVLDIGCATGFFLQAARDSGFDPFGVEISEYASQIAKENLGQEKIFTGAMAEANFPGNYFNLITMWDCIEHLPNPSQELSIIYKSLCPGGLLVLTTPNANSLAHKIFRDKWMGYKDEEHLYYFSDKNICLLLQLAGFKIIKKENVGKFVPMAVFLQRLSLYSKPLSAILSFFMAKAGLKDFSLYINPGDIMCIYAQKNENNFNNNSGI
jgi:2-polyprenyl-3-methyl-5-hydroxy-6-metoxy-1,4-benzoquinol methylase